MAMNWREPASAIGVSLADLDTVLADGVEDDVLRYLQPSPAFARSPAFLGRQRAFGRSPGRSPQCMGIAAGCSPQRPGPASASPKRRHGEMYGSSLCSPFKRFSPGPSTRVGGPAASPSQRQTRPLLSTNGVFAKGSEACFRAPRGPMLPLVR
jgi:hypothetical protein